MEKISYKTQNIGIRIRNNAFYTLNVANKLCSNAFSPMQHIYFNKFTVVKLCYLLNFVSFSIITIIKLFCSVEQPNKFEDIYGVCI